MAKPEDQGSSATPIPTEDAAVVLPMLERMARRMAWVGAKCPPGDGSEDDLWENWADDGMRETMLSVARAGLEAIRDDPSMMLVSAMSGEVRPIKGGGTSFPASCWTAPIDAILSGEA